MQPRIPIYEIRNLKHQYNGATVLDIPALSIPRNSISGFMGPNGSGKSTLLGFMAFTDEPSEGEIRFKGKREQPFSDTVRFQVTLLPQTPYLMKRTVWKNVLYGLQLRKQTEDAPQRVSEALEMVGLEPSVFAQRQWHELSGGEAQRVALAARLILRPEVLLMDEPTASVDAGSIRQIKDAALRAKKEWGTTLIIASHDIQWLHNVSDQVFHLFRGRIFGSGHESMIFGPWEAGEKGLWFKKLNGNLYIAVSPPPAENSVAIFPPESFRIGMPKNLASPPFLPLNGTVSRISLENRKDRIVADIRIANICLTTLLSPEEAQQKNLYPGRSVLLYYDPFAVKWV